GACVSPANLTRLARRDLAEMGCSMLRPYNGSRGARLLLAGLAGVGGVAADQGGVDEEAEADGQGDDGDGGGGPGVGFALDGGNQAHGDDETYRSAGEQDAPAAGAGGLRELRDHGDIGAAGDGGEAFLGA